MIQPCLIVLAAVPSWARVIVSASPTWPVIRTISAFVGVIAPNGQTVALKGKPENSVPVPTVTVSVVPDVAGDGAVTTRLQALFGCWSNEIYSCLSFGLLSVNPGAATPTTQTILPSEPYWPGIQP